RNERCYQAASNDLSYKSKPRRPPRGRRLDPIVRQGRSFLQAEMLAQFSKGAALGTSLFSVSDASQKRRDGSTLLRSVANRCLAGDYRTEAVLDICPQQDYLPSVPATVHLFSKGGGKMSKRPPRPQGFPWLIPYLIVKDADAAIEFYQKAF